MPTLAIAALSARALAEAAARCGHTVLALDLFGDADTRRAAARWWPVGDADQRRIDPARLGAALRQAAARHGAVGWIAGSGFEADLDMLSAGAAVLPLIGNPAPVWARVQDPAQFFGCLRAHGLPHPAVQRHAPADLAGWLRKDSASSGGSRVQAAAALSASGAAGTALPPTALAPSALLPTALPPSALPPTTLPPTACYQRVAAGRPVSATFIGNGSSAVLLGFNQQRVQALPGRPYTFAGVVGPVALPAAAAGVMRRALAVLVAEFGLRGLGSLDALLDGDQISLLEINPRPPASLALYPRCGALGLVDAHWQACVHGILPALPSAGLAAPAAPLSVTPAEPPSASPSMPSAVSPSASPSMPPTEADAAVAGLATVYARQAMQIDAAAAALIAGWPGAHDLPLPGSRVAAGDPLCSLSASGADAPAVQARLDQQTERLLAMLACPPAPATTALATNAPAATAQAATTPATTPAATAPATTAPAAPSSTPSLTAETCAR